MQMPNTCLTICSNLCLITNPSFLWPIFGHRKCPAHISSQLQCPYYFSESPCLLWKDGETLRCHWIQLRQKKLSKMKNLQKHRNTRLRNFQTLLTKHGTEWVKWTIGWECLNGIEYESANGTEAHTCASYRFTNGQRCLYNCCLELPLHHPLVGISKAVSWICPL